jgi:predicted acylesterase/phospholipase RssA
MGLLVHRPRSTTAYALRDSELVRLTPQVFAELAHEHPELLRATSRVLVERLERHMSGAAHARVGAHSFAIVPVSPSVDMSWFVTELGRALATYGSLRHLSAAKVDAELGKPGIARSTTTDAAHLRLSAWLMGQERLHDFILYEADARWSEWTDRALRNADQIVYVADGAAKPDLGEAAAKLAGRGAGSGARLPRQNLVLLQSDTKILYPSTGAWLEGRALDAHHHVRRGNRADIARVARLLTGNAIGLVMSGGGSRGYAHVGVVRAFEELGIPIDVAGGASMGAVVAGSLAVGMTSEDMLKNLPPVLMKSFFDPTLPVASLMSGENATKALRKFAHGADIEDSVLPMFTVSTNLTRGEQVVHRRGPIWEAIRASSSVPGIFPPVPWRGDLLVDGGLTNNLPTDVMTTLFGGKVIAIDVIPEVDLPAEGDLPAHVSGWSMLVRKLNPLSRGFAMPTILSVLMRSATASSRGFRRKEEMLRECELYLRPSVSRWNIVDFSAARPLADEGYRGTHVALREWWKKKKPKSP